MIGEASSPLNSMLFPPHIEKMAKSMSTTSTFVACWRSRSIIQCPYVNDKAQEESEEDSEIE